MNRIKRGISALPAWILTIVVSLGILWLTLAPRPLGEVEIEAPFQNADKVCHGIMFAVLTLVASVDCARGRSFRKLPWYECLFIALLASLSGVVIEYAQREMELGRSFDYYDMLADAIGAYSVALAWITAESFRHDNTPDTL